MCFSFGRKQNASASFSLSSQRETDLVFQLSRTSWLLWFVFARCGSAVVIVRAPPPKTTPESVEPLCKVWLKGCCIKGKPIVPETFFHYRREVFRFCRSCQWKLFKPLGKHQLLSLCWQHHQSQGRRDPSIVSSKKKRRLCVCILSFVSPLYSSGVRCEYCSAESMWLTALWSIRLHTSSPCDFCKHCRHEWKAAF